MTTVIISKDIVNNTYFLTNEHPTYENTATIKVCYGDSICLENLVINSISLFVRLCNITFINCLFVVTDVFYIATRLKEATCINCHCVEM